MRTKFLIFPVLALLPFLPAVTAHSPAQVVSPESMPPPWLDTTAVCHPRMSLHSHDPPIAVCDPSSLLSKRQLSRLDSMIDRISTGHAPYSLVSCQESLSDVPRGFRVAIALVRRMAFDGRTLSDRAQNFANLLFANWNLNQNCGASVLLFLSLDDRRIFIRTGPLAAKYLDEKQIDDVYSSIIPRLEKKQTFAALEAALSKIGSYLSKYRGSHPSSPDSRNPQSGASGASVPLFFRNGPPWWDLELSIVSLIAAFLVVIACCNGVGGPEAARKKRERRHVLRKLDLLRSEYVAAMLPQYSPSTCPYCQADLSAPWEPTVPTLSPNVDNLQSANTEVRDVHFKPIRTLRCGHTFHESCFIDEHPGISVFSLECPVCLDRGEDTSIPPTLSSTRHQDFSFRLHRLHEEYPHIITPPVLAKLESEDPSTWPETMTEAYLRRSTTRQERGEQRETNDGSWWPAVGGAVAAGGIGALLASMMGNWGRGQQNESYANIPSENGGHVGRWGGMNESQLGGGGHGTGWGNALSDAASRFSGGGGFGRSWGGGGGGGNYGAGGGGGHGTGWGFGGGGGGNGAGGGGGHGTGW